MRFVVSLIFFFFLKDRSLNAKWKKLKLDGEIVFEMDI